MLRSLGGGLAPVVVVSLGTNDADGSEPEFRKLVYQAVAIVGPRRCLVWATVVRDGTPRTGFNQVLEEARSAHPQHPPGRVGGARRRRRRAARRRPRARHAGGIRATRRGDRARDPRLPGGVNLYAPCPCSGGTAGPRRLAARGRGRCAPSGGAGDRRRQPRLALGSLLPRRRARAAAPLPREARAVAERGRRLGPRRSRRDPGRPPPWRRRRSRRRRAGARARLRPLRSSRRGRCSGLRTGRGSAVRRASRSRPARRSCRSRSSGQTRSSGRARGSRAAHA